MKASLNVYEASLNVRVASVYVRYRKQKNKPPKRTCGKRELICRKAVDNLCESTVEFDKKSREGELLFGNNFPKISIETPTESFVNICICAFQGRKIHFMR